MSIGFESKDEFETCISAYLAAWPIERIYTPQCRAETFFVAPIQYPWLGDGWLSNIRERTKYPAHCDYVLQVVENYTEDFLREVDRETGWEWIDKLPALDPALGKEVGLGQRHCPYCDTQHRVHLRKCGVVTGLICQFGRTCSCTNYRRFWRIWGDPKIVPPRFRNVSYNHLRTSRESILSPERQEEIIAQVKAYRHSSYFFYGPAGTGKTHIATALFRAALSEWAFKRTDGRDAVWLISANRLLAEHQEYDTRDLDERAPLVPLPSVTTRKIKSARADGLRVTLVLDELDKVKMSSDYRIGVLTEIINTVYTCDGQIIATSNKSLEQLCHAWGNDVAETIVRRIGGLGKGERAENLRTIFFGEERKIE
jgi:hypothetical protein